MKASPVLGIFLLSVTIYSGTAHSNGIFYNEVTKKISARNDAGESYLVFEETSHGNSEVFFDYFNGQAALVHDNNSLISYSSYSTIVKDGDGFKFDCVYLELKNNRNGINSREGVCGINKHIPNKSVLSGEENSEVIEHMIQRLSNVSTDYFIDGKTERLPILLFQSESSFVYKIYYNKNDFLEGKYSIVRCENKPHICTIYNGEPWFILYKGYKVPFLLKIGQRTNEGLHLMNTGGVSVNNKSSFMPFTVKKERAFFYDNSLNKKKSYLIKGDKVTLLSYGEQLCKVAFLNNENNAVVGSVMCSDLSL